MIKSALHAAGAVTAHQLFHFIDTDAVEVAGNAVLQAGSRHGELQRLLLIFIMGQPIEQTAAEAVTAADTVDDIADLIPFGFIEAFPVIQAGRPAVPVGALALTQGDGDHLHVRVSRQDLVTQGLVFRAVQFAGFHHDIGRDLEGLLDILFVGDSDVNVIRDLAHAFIPYFHRFLR